MKVSVIIPTYNRVHFICDTIESILSQTFKDFEIIVVDDGSTDNTKEALKKYTKSLHYIYQENKGRSEARNTGIKVAKGKYIAFLDDDDIWLPHKLQRQVDFLDSHTDIGLVHTFTEVIDGRGRLLEEATKKRLKFYKKAMRIGYDYEGMSRLCVMFLSSVMLRKECLDKVGLFDPCMEAFEDWDFYLRFALVYRIGTIPEPLVRFRAHPIHSTSEEFTRSRIEVAKKHLAIVNSCTNQLFSKRVSYNFYLHLANTYYINLQLEHFRFYAWKVLRLNPYVLVYSRLGLHLLFSFIPLNILLILRRWKDSSVKTLSVYPERIFPEETSGGPLASHLKRYDFIRQFCKDKIILDAACGAGYGANYLSDVAKEVFAVDIAENAINYAEKHYKKDNLEFKIMDVYNLDFPDRYFDIVCAFETLEHLDEPERFVSEAKRVLKEDGIFFVSTPNVKKTTYNPKNPYHKVEFSYKDFGNLLKKYFINVEILGQRRLQSNLHYYLQKLDIFHLRAILPSILRRKFCHTLATSSWDEVGLEDFVIDKEGLRRATELIGVCRVF